jgi:hypothetical protein
LPFGMGLPDPSSQREMVQHAAAEK